MGRGDSIALGLRVVTHRNCRGEFARLPVTFWWLKMAARNRDRRGMNLIDF
jgi:hypothetical protein